MIKFFFLLFLIYSSNSHAQDSKDLNIKELVDPVKQSSLDIVKNSSLKKYSYPIHTIGISTRLGGAGTFNVAGDGHLGLSTTTFDFYLGKRRGKTQIAFLMQFRLSDVMGQPTGNILPKYPFLNEFRWGMSLGASQYIFDYRNRESGLGWSMMVNGGLFFDLPTLERMKDLENSLVNIGTELDFKVAYNFHKYTAITFGFNLGYTISYTLRGKPELDHEGFPIPTPIGLYLEHALVWGFSVGFLF